MKASERSTKRMLRLGSARLISTQLVPGARGWKAHQQNLARAHLSSARLELAGRSWLDVVREERLETWLQGRRSPTRRRLLQPLAAQLRREERLPAGVEDPVAPLRWLLGELAGGQTLTQTGNLNRAFVQDAAGRFGWWDAGSHGLPRSEDELYDLHQVRRLAQRLGLIRRSGRTLGLTTNGRAPPTTCMTPSPRSCTRKAGATSAAAPHPIGTSSTGPPTPPPTSSGR